MSRFSQFGKLNQANKQATKALESIKPTPEKKGLLNWLKNILKGSKA